MVCVSFSVWANITKENGDENFKADGSLLLFELQFLGIKEKSALI